MQRLLLLCCIVFALASAQTTAILTSPNGALQISFAPAGGTYSVTSGGKPVLAPSRLGLEFDGLILGPAAKITGTKPIQVSETYTVPHGKANPIKNAANGMSIQYEDAAGRRFTVEARAYDDGVAFRYLVPNLGAYKLRRELTSFNFAKEGMAFPLVLNNFRTSYEDSYAEVPLSSIKRDALVALPFLAEVPGAAWVAITEAHLENYAGLYLNHGQGRTLEARLSPRIDQPEFAVIGQGDFQSPWRVLLIGAQPGRLVESNIVLNLNPPAKIADTRWIKPGKVAWSWWSGDYATNVPFQYGMNTETMKHYIDFAASAGLEYVLLDEGWSARMDGRSRDLTRTNPALNLPELLQYAAAKKVKLWLWAYWTYVDKQMDQAFPLFEQWGVAGVKMDFMDRDDQQMVDFYHRVAQKAAQHHLMLDFHGAYKPTGMHRTWPNVLNYEGVMGAEYLKWSARATPVHNVTIPFTRMLAGPMDYTPGGFNNVSWADFTPRQLNPMVPTTRAHQVALFVVLEAPFQMLCDYPGAYLEAPELPFLKAVPATWDETRVLAGRPGRFAVIARRSGATWYIGGITGFDATDVDLKLDFLAAGRYTATTYADVPGNPKATVRANRTVTRASTLKVSMAPTGGWAAILTPAR